MALLIVAGLRSMAQVRMENATPRHPGKSSAVVEIENVVRRFDAHEALSCVSLTLYEGEFFTLLGPSGCGKTTLLRLIAGLDHPDEGAIRIAGVDARDIPAHQRPTNTVFQSYALFPHMTVFDNIAFGPRMKNLPEADVAKRVRRAMEMARIADLAGRTPSRISGGQKQRVALARAVVNEPRVLLLDEPLGALDLNLRKQLQVELRALQRRLGITFLHVTHDQQEALALSDRIAVMREGKIEQIADARTLYERPRTRFVAQFLGSCNIFEAAVTRRDDNDAIVTTQLGALTVRVGSDPRSSFPVAIRPERILLGNPTSTTGNVVRARIEALAYAGAETHYTLDANGRTLVAHVSNGQAGTLAFQTGQQVTAVLPEEALMVLDE